MLWWMIEDGRLPVKDNWTFDEKYYFMTKNADGSYSYAQALSLDEDETTDMLIDYFEKREKIMVSFGPIEILRCILLAILLKAAILSPWLPVVMITVFSSG